MGMGVRVCKCAYVYHTYIKYTHTHTHTHIRTHTQTDDDEGVDLLALLVAELVPSFVHQLSQLLREHDIEILDCVLFALLHLFESILHLPSPPKFGASVYNHADVLFYPF